MIEHLTKVLRTIPGVEVVEYVPKPVSLTPVIEAFNNYHADYVVDLRFNNQEHPAVVILTDSFEDDKYKETILEAIDTFRVLMTDKDPSKYYPLPGPIKGCGALACHIMINNFPVRVVVSYNAYAQGYLTSLDTVRTILCS